jgi:phage baseplate assembly protein W
MTRRTYAQLQDLYGRLGRDLLLGWRGPAGDFTDADLAAARRPGLTGQVVDLTVAAEVTQAVQFLANRLSTRRGELAALGHADYGSRHHELIGEPNTERTRNLVKLYVLECLRQEPRVAKVLRCVVRTADGERDIVRIELTLRLIEHDDPLNLVVPIALAGAA